jgi:hypothetical protein
VKQVLEDKREQNEDRVGVHARSLGGWWVNRNVGAAPASRGSSPRGLCVIKTHPLPLAVFRYSLWETEIEYEQELRSAA